MKISALRKIYPSLSKEMKNIKWRPLTDKEIEAALKERQKVCDCYSNAARYALFHSEKGSEILKKRIRIQQTDSNEPAYKFLLTVNGKDEIYRVNPKDYIKKYFKLFKRYNEEPAGSGNFAESETRNFNLAADIAICKLIKKHPEQKGIFLRLFKFPYAANQLCEFNRPSRAFEWFSGIVPEKITETKIHKSLKDKPKETKKLLEELAQINPENYSFIVLSGSKKLLGIKSWHCLPIKNISAQNKTVTLANKRTGEDFVFFFDEIIDSFKSIVGIRWNK